jgi:hypothetical protein
VTKRTVTYKPNRWYLLTCESYFLNNNIKKW